ncbi:MAG: hypothetical protein ABIR39_23410 [Nocardioides sp.]|uniref:malate dehydrogenase n=1 Tax=Nocardioides sp. TaxID=35761 RepID=UPI003266E175
MKVAIVGGAGGIGSSVAFNLLQQDVDVDISVVDTRPNMITSHVMDMQDVLSLGRNDSTVRAGDADDVVGADIVVLSAAVPLRLNTSRDVFLKDNAEVVRAVVSPLKDSAFGGSLVIMTNPVDPLVSYARVLTDLPRERVVGYSLNDSLRFRFGLAEALDVHPRRVKAWVVGEHGPHQVPMYDRVELDGRRVNITAEVRTATQDYIENWYVRHVSLDSGRTSTWSSGLGGALMVRSMIDASESPFPVSVELDGEYGVRGASMSVPALLGPDGVREIIEWD